jgi:HTH-type transcriptional regulator/antitoxin HigA
MCRFAAKGGILEPCIGPRGRVSEILNRTRPLTLEMIRKLAESLKLPAEVLIRPYRLRRADEERVVA